MTHAAKSRLSRSMPPGDAHLWRPHAERHENASRLATGNQLTVDSGGLGPRRTQVPWTTHAHVLPQSHIYTCIADIRRSRADSATHRDAHLKDPLVTVVRRAGLRTRVP